MECSIQLFENKLKLFRLGSNCFDTEVSDAIF